MSKPVIAVTGKDGQLGSELQALAAQHPEFQFVFTGSHELNITDPQAVAAFFQQHAPQFLINCAAYTAVDKAESEQETAFCVNAEAVGTLAKQCVLHNCLLITISTDYVFNGMGYTPYLPADETSPVNYYGYTKWMGEKLALTNNPRTIVIRTSWVYSVFGKNFVKTMLSLMKNRTEISVVNDQFGSPTYARDLASAMLDIIHSIKKGNAHYGIYHYSNTGAISWFEFAQAIRHAAGLNCEIKPIPTTAYPTPAKRPAYSVLDTTSIQAAYHLKLIPWESSLQKCISELTKS